MDGLTTSSSGVTSIGGVLYAVSANIGAAPPGPGGGGGGGMVFSSGSGIANIASFRNGGAGGNGLVAIFW